MFVLSQSLCVSSSNTVLVLESYVMAQGIAGPEDEFSEFLALGGKKPEAAVKFSFVQCPT